MSLTADQIKTLVDIGIINKTAPYSIDHLDVGVILKNIIDFIQNSKVEIITFVNQSSIEITWNATRQINFGLGAIFLVEILSEDGVFRQSNQIEIVPDDITSPSKYTINLGGSATGRILIR